MKIERESFFPNSKFVGLVEDSIKDIKPDIPELYEWHKSYVSNHKARIAHDLKIVSEM